jgi:hypothetical protein
MAQQDWIHQAHVSPESQDAQERAFQRANDFLDYAMADLISNGPKVQWRSSTACKDAPNLHPSPLMPVRETRRKRTDSTLLSQESID